MKNCRNCGNYQSVANPEVLPDIYDGFCFAGVTKYGIDTNNKVEFTHSLAGTNCRKYVEVEYADRID